MVSTSGILSLVVSLAVALIVVFLVNRFIFGTDFDPRQTIITIIIVGIALTIGSMVAGRITGRKAVEAPKVKISG